MPLEHQSLSHEIIAAAIDVHRAFGPGFVESVYHNALAIELAHRQIPFEQEVRVPIRHREKPVGLHVLDLVADQRIVVELKAVRELEDVHFAILRSYLRAANLEHGLLLNFAGTTLQIRRVSARAGIWRPKAI